MTHSAHYDAVVIGGGAAGLMCAIEAGRRGRRVVVLEHNAEIGRKILISGGGRCNFTNIHCQPENFVSANAHFAKSALARYTPADFIALVRKHKIPYHEKTLGQLFCDRSARDITGMLLEECRAAGVEIKTGCGMRDVRRNTGFVVETPLGPLQTAALVIAAGGLSIPRMGATDLGYRIARRFSIAIREPWPALVPLTFSREDLRKWGNLSGVSAEVEVTLAGPPPRSPAAPSFREKMLFTHRGLSGPAILQISSYASGRGTRPTPIAIDLLPGVDILGELLRRKRAGERAETKTILAEHLPARLSERWLQWNAVSKPLPATSDDDLRALGDRLHHWTIAPQGTEGYGKAEVTAGGVDTNELSSRTMESKSVPGLFFIGEVVDVTGWLGGFNFQWAWASGAAAGRTL